MNVIVFMRMFTNNLRYEALHNITEKANEKDCPRASNTQKYFNFKIKYSR